jgi:hypothetical protein
VKAGWKMLTRVAQRTAGDCQIAVVATVMGPPYTYERVLEDQKRYPKLNSDGSFSACYETYLRDEGFRNEYHDLSEADALIETGKVAGILTLAPLTGIIGHVVAIDERGFINPSTNWPERIRSLNHLPYEYSRLGVRYLPEREFLAVWL